MKKIRTKSLLILLLCVGGLVGLLAGVHHLQTTRIAAAFLREANRARDENRDSLALEYLRRYVEIAPGDIDSLATYGVRLADAGFLEQAYFVLEKTLRQKPELTEARRKLIEVAAQRSRYSEAIANIELLQGNESVDEPELMELKAECFVMMNQYEQAREAFESVVTAHPGRLETYIKLADLLHSRLKKQADANACLDRMVASNPNTGEAYERRGLWRLTAWNALRGPNAGAGKLPNPHATAAEREQVLRINEDAEQARKLLPASSALMAFSARAALAAHDLPQAREFALQALNIDSKNADAYLALAQIETELDHRTAALEILKQGALALPEERNLLWNYANALIDQDHESEIPEIVQKLKKLNVPEEFVGYLNGRLALSQKDWLAGTQLLEKIRPRLTDWPGVIHRIDLALGDAFGEMNASEQQVQSFRRAVDFDPLSAALRVKYARALQMAGFWRPAVDEYRRLITLGEATDALKLQLATCLCRLGMERAATDRDWQEFDELTASLERQESYATAVTLLRMDKMAALEQWDDAQHLAKQFREQSPTDLDRWIKEISVASGLTDDSRLNELLAEAQSQFGDVPTLRILKAKVLVRRRAADAAAQIQALCDFPASWSLDAQQTCRKEFAVLFLALDKYDEAERLARTAVEAAPADLSVALILFEAGWRSRRAILMNDALERIRRIAGENADWHYGQALLLSGKAAETSDEQLRMQAHRHLAQAKALRPTWSRIPVLQAELARQQSGPQAALDHLMEAISLGDRDPGVLTYAVSLLCSMERFVEADRVIRRLQDARAPLSTELIRSASDISLRLDNPTRALELAEQVVDESAQPSDVVWLSQMLASAGKGDEAEALLRNLIEKGEGNPAAWVALIQILVRNGHVEDARQIMTRAEKSITSGDAPLVLAQGFEILGEVEQADFKYQQAMSAAPENIALSRRFAEFLIRNGRRPEAIQQLKALYQLTNRDGDDNRDHVWAAQNLAILLSDSPDPAQRQEALALMDSLSAKQKSPEQVDRLRAILLAKTSSARSRQQAITILEGLVKKEAKALPEDRFLLANLYELTGQRSKSRAQLRQLIGNANIDDPRYLVAYIELALKSGEASDAEAWLNRLSAIRPDAPEIADFQARVLFSKQRYSEAADLMRSHVQRALEAENSSHQAALLMGAIQRCQEWNKQLRKAGEQEQAAHFQQLGESWVKVYLGQHPHEELLLAGFYVETGRIDEALNVFEKQAAASDPAKVVSFVVSVIQASDASPAQLQRLQELLDSSNHDRKLELLNLIAADLTSFRGEYQEAVTRYRGVLQVNPKGVAAMNNLAILLALTGGDRAEAMALIDRAVKEGGPQDVLIDSRGLLHFAAGDFAEAASDFEAATRERESASRCLHLAAAYGRLKQLSKAKQAFDRAIELGLQEAQLHPLERPLFQDVKSQIGKPSFRTSNENQPFKGIHRSAA